MVDCDYETHVVLDIIQEVFPRYDFLAVCLISLLGDPSHLALCLSVKYRIVNSFYYFFNILSLHLIFIW